MLFTLKKKKTPRCNAFLNNTLPVFSVVTQGALRDDTKNGCVAD